LDELAEDAIPDGLDESSHQNNENSQYDLLGN
jgi:hypothetical protein